MNKEDVNIRNNSRKPSQSSPQPSKTDIVTESQDVESPTWSKYEMFFYVISYVVMFLIRLGKDLYKSVLGRVYPEQVLPDHISDLKKTSKKLHLENSSRTPFYTRHLTWIQRKKISLRQYVKAFKSYMLSSEDDRNFHYSKRDLLAKEKSYLIPELPKEFGPNGAIIKTTAGLPLSIENTTPSTSKRITESCLPTESEEIKHKISAQNIDLQNENITLSDSEDDDSIVIAYLKDKNITVEVENSLTRRKISVLEKVPKMETIQEGEQFAAFRGPSLTSNQETSPDSVKDTGELSESSLDVHIPSFPGSPRSLNFGSGNSTGSHGSYFAEAIEFLHEDKDFLIAAETGNHKILEILLRQNANIQETDHLGRTALHLAVCSDSEQAVILLLNATIKTNIKDNLGMTPLSLCLMRRPSYNIANLLFNHGAEITLRSNPVDTGLFLQFVMMCTPTKEDEKILKLLVEKGAIVNDPEAPGGRQPLHFAAMSNNCRLIRILVRLGADMSLTNHRNETPKDVAGIFECREAYELLSDLEESSDISSESQSSE